MLCKKITQKSPKVKYLKVTKESEKSINNRGKIKENHGITLVSLIVTIIILLIFVGVALSLIVGENGIIKKSITSAKQYDISTAKEQAEMLAATYASNYYEEENLSGNGVP